MFRFWGGRGKGGRWGGRREEKGGGGTDVRMRGMGILGMTYRGMGHEV